MTFEDLEQYVEDAVEQINDAAEQDYNRILLDNRNIDSAMKDQIDLQFKWESLVGLISGLVEECSLFAEQSFSQAFENRMTNDNRQWSTTDAKILSQSDEQYIAAKRLENRCKTAKREADGFLKVVETRKYTLKNLTSLIIAGSDKYIL